MERGPNIDITTGRPIEGGGPKAAQQAQAREAHLKEKAERLGIVHSREGVMLQEILQKRLLARVDTLINEDPEARAYAAVLKDMGHTENLARQAVNVLYERSIRKEG